VGCRRTWPRWGARARWPRLGPFRRSVWEAWVARFAADLAGPLGMVASPFDSTRRVLRWEGTTQSWAPSRRTFSSEAQTEPSGSTRSTRCTCITLRAAVGRIVGSDAGRAPRRSSPSIGVCDACGRQHRRYAPRLPAAVPDTAAGVDAYDRHFRPAPGEADSRSSAVRVSESPSTDEHVQRFRALLAA